jgi:hypothetical protein
MEEKNEIDKSILKGPIILFSVCLVISSTLMASSYYFNDKLNKEYVKNNRVFQSISRQYLDVDEEEKLLRDYYPEFVKLYNKGIIGREKRLNWIESLRQAGEKIKLPSMSYSISSQQEYIPEYSVNYSGYTLYRSGMELNLGLLHEGDLFKLIDYIDRIADGIYSLSNCTFSMNGKDILYDKDRANVSVSCSLYWITIDLPGGQGIKIG